MARSKGLTAFAIFFIAWGLLTVFGALEGLIYYFLMIFSPEADVIVQSARQAPAIIDWVISIAYLTSGAFLFSAAYYYLRRESCAIKSLTAAVISFVIAHLASISIHAEDLIKLKSGVEPVFGANQLAMFLALDIIAILIWVLILWYFNTKTIKKQLK